MGVREMIPWSSINRSPALGRDENRNPLLTLHREMNRLFDDMWRGLDGRLPAASAMSPFGAGWPSIELAETDKEIKVSAELPGLDEKDVEVLLDSGTLVLKGEKRSEIEDKERQFSERSYGRFERRIPLAADIDEAKVEASFRNGLLKVVLPKNAAAQSQVKRIEIKK